MGYWKTKNLECPKRRYPPFLHLLAQFFQHHSLQSIAWHHILCSRDSCATCLWVHLHFQSGWPAESPCSQHGRLADSRQHRCPSHGRKSRPRIQAGSLLRPRAAKGLFRWIGCTSIDCRVHTNQTTQCHATTQIGCFLGCGRQQPPQDDQLQHYARLSSAVMACRCSAKEARDC